MNGWGSNQAYFHAVYRRELIPGENFHDYKLIHDIQIRNGV